MGGLRGRGLEGGAPQFSPGRSSQPTCPAEARQEEQSSQTAAASGVPGAGAKQSRVELLACCGLAVGLLHAAVASAASLSHPFHFSPTLFGGAAFCHCAPERFYTRATAHCLLAPWRNADARPTDACARSVTRQTCRLASASLWPLACQLIFGRGMCRIGDRGLDVPASPEPKQHDLSARHPLARERVSFCCPS